MSIYADFQNTVNRFKNHIEEFQNIYRKYGLSFGRPRDIWAFIKQLRSDKPFRNEVKNLGQELMRLEGAKLTLPVLFAIIALSIGGIGIAGMGSAIGIPMTALAGILSFLGFGVGQEIDTLRNNQTQKYETIEQPISTETAYADEEEAPFREFSIEEEKSEAFVYASALESIAGTLEEVARDKNQISNKLDMLRGGIDSLKKEINAIKVNHAYIQEQTEKLSTELVSIKGIIDAERVASAERNDNLMRSQVRLQYTTYGLAGIIITSVIWIGYLLIRSIK